MVAVHFFKIEMSMWLKEWNEFLLEFIANWRTKVDLKMQFRTKVSDASFVVRKLINNFISFDKINPFYNFLSSSLFIDSTGKQNFLEKREMICRRVRIENVTISLEVAVCGNRIVNVWQKQTINLRLSNKSEIYDDCASSIQT